jgi:hypothetical protein
MLARPMLLLPLLAMGTGCLHTMGSAGFVSMALHKDMSESRRKCDMPQDEWLRLCDNRPPKKTSVECPSECRPLPPLEAD